MKFHIEYSNGKKLSIAGYLKALAKTQNIEEVPFQKIREPENQLILKLH